MPPKGDLVRARLLDLARGDPGLPVAEAARCLGLDATTVAYHVRVLERRGRLAQVRAGHRSALFATAAGPCTSVRPAMPLLRDPAARAAAWMLLRGPVASLEVHLRTGVTRQRAWRILRNLTDAGLAARTGRVFTIQPGLAPCLARTLQRQRCGGQCEAPPSPPTPDLARPMRRPPRLRAPPVPAGPRGPPPARPAPAAPPMPAPGVPRAVRLPPGIPAPPQLRPEPR